MDSFDAAALASEPLVVFCVATAGKGNIARFLLDTASQIVRRRFRADVVCSCDVPRNQLASVHVALFPVT